MTNPTVKETKGFQIVTPESLFSRDDLSIVEKTKQGQEWGYGRTWLDHALNGFYNLVRRYGRSTEFDTLSPRPSTPEDWERADNAYKTVLIHLGRELLRN